MNNMSESQGWLILMTLNDILALLSPPGGWLQNIALILSCAYLWLAIRS